MPVTAHEVAMAHTVWAPHFLAAALVEGFAFVVA